MKTRFLALLIFTAIVFAPIAMTANSGGQIGRTGKGLGATGCGTAQCHGGGGNTNTFVMFMDEIFSPLLDSITVATGSTTTFNVVVNHETALAAGVNIAAKTTETGGTNAGALQTVSGGNLQLVGPELTHFTPVLFAEKTVTFTFKWVAPVEPGLYFLRAISNAVNGNGERSGDEWNWAPVLRVRVTPTNGVEDVSQNPLTALGIAPVPAHDEVTFSAVSTPGAVYTVNVLDLTGTMIFSDIVTPSTNELRYVWNGTTSSGLQAPAGSYVVAISGAGSVLRGRTMIAR